MAEVQAEPLVAPGHVAPEVDAQGELGGLDRRQAALDQVFQVLGDHAHHGLALEVLDPRHIGQRAVAAGLCQERHVVAGALVAIRPAEVEDLDPPHVAVLWLGQIGPGVDHIDVGDLKRPLLGVVRDNKDGHDTPQICIAYGRSDLN